MAVMNIGAVFEYGHLSSVLHKIGGIGACDTGAGGLAVKVAKKYQPTPAFCNEYGEEKRMDVDDEGTPQTSPVPSDANMPAELLVSFKLALEFAFSMLSFILHNLMQKASPFSCSTLNPYLSVMLTFLATVTKHAETLSVMERSIPWHVFLPPFHVISSPRRGCSSHLFVGVNVR
ncbi:hypothetical protein BDR03DRAFT_1018778 [Suillus americanus]|nr:hypothetical protein BDR03DRAFT_1018778 [Suillus americanus]